MAPELQTYEQQTAVRCTVHCELISKVVCVLNYTDTRSHLLFAMSNGRVPVPTIAVREEPGAPHARSQLLVFFRRGNLSSSPRL